MQRKQLEILRQRVENEPRRHIQVLFGPRQVGKTTLVRQLLEITKMPSHYATADGITGNAEVWIAQQWQSARIKLNTSESPDAILVIDEIQKIANWSEYIKLEWDNDTAHGVNLKVILLGSSRLLLQQGLTESLTGRFETTYLPHWSYAEMKEIAGLSVDEYIWFGGYPGAIALMHDEARWKDYMRDSIIETSISRDILMLTRVDKPALIRQLFEIGSLYSGQILSFNKILGQLQDAGNSTTLSQYLVLLDQAGLLAGISKYSPDVLRQRSSIQKFQVHDMALMSAREPDDFKEVHSNPARWGRWLESAVGAHLLNQCLSSDYKLYYWRDGNNEVDFIIEGKRKVIAIEVKTVASRPRSGMDAFKRRYNPDRVLLVEQSGLSPEEFLELGLEDLF